MGSKNYRQEYSLAGLGHVSIWISINIGGNGLYYNVSYLYTYKEFIYCRLKSS